jgi:glutaminyl-tRNA synthetase
MYDYAHPISDALEGITHSLCTLEFENNREIYDWLLDNIDYPFPSRPSQYEFVRLDIEGTVLSKRKLLHLVENKLVVGWDDPRLPTLAGMRRKGITPAAIRAFCQMIGISKANSVIEPQQLDFCLREDLNDKAPRVMAVFNPLKVIIDNYEEVAMLDPSYWPHDIPKNETREIPFTKEIYIERSDFEEVPPPQFYRLSVGKEVRLRYAYCITCTHVDKDGSGNITTLHCVMDKESRSGGATSGKKVKGVIHWVPSTAIKAKARLFGPLFLDEAKEELQVNPHSLIEQEILVEPSLINAKGGEHYQFERQGYFFTDPIDTKEGTLLFNHVVSLKDSWKKRTAAV